MLVRAVRVVAADALRAVPPRHLAVEESLTRVSGPFDLADTHLARLDERKLLLARNDQALQTGLLELGSHRKEGLRHQVNDCSSATIGTPSPRWSCSPEW